MIESLTHHLTTARAAIIAGNAPLALESLDRFNQAAAQTPPDAATRVMLQSRIAEMRDLAEAAQRGSKLAIDQVRAIVEAARSLQTYDDAGQRHVSSIVAHEPRRF